MRGKPPYLRSKLRRGRWFHTYRRNGTEASLGVHGLHPADPKVLAAWAAAHARYEHSKSDEAPPRSGTFAWGLDMYLASDHWTKKLSEGSKESRARTFERYRKKQGDRPLATITHDGLERALIAKGGFPAINDLKALKPMFAYLKQIGAIAKDPAKGIKLDKPQSKGFPTASAEEIAAFQKRWPVGTVQRLAFDLALYTGAARADLVHLGRHNIRGNILTYTRRKSGATAHVPIKAELAEVIARTPDIAPTFLLTSAGRPRSAKALGTMMGEAAREAGIDSRLHGLRKAFCVYWAEKGQSAHQIASMAGHLTLSEVQRYTDAADRRRIVELIAGA